MTRPRGSSWPAGSPTRRAPRLAGDPAFPDRQRRRGQLPRSAAPDLNANGKWRAPRPEGLENRVSGLVARSAELDETRPGRPWLCLEPIRRFGRQAGREVRPPDYPRSPVVFVTEADRVVESAGRPCSVSPRCNAGMGWRVGSRLPVHEPASNATAGGGPQACRHKTSDQPVTRSFFEVARPAAPPAAPMGDPDRPPGETPFVNIVWPYRSPWLTSGWWQRVASLPNRGDRSGKRST